MSRSGERIFQGFSSSFENSSYSPPNFTAGNEMYALAWALPYGISTAFLLVYLFNRLRRKSSQLSEDKYLVTFCAAAIAIPLTFLGFVSFVLSPGAAVERYVSVSTYFLMMLPAGIVAGLILRKTRTVHFVPALCVLALSVGVGAYSPDVAPLEHRDFESQTPRYDAYLELSSLEKHIPAESYMYVDNDIPPFGQLRSDTLIFRSPKSYQDTRQVLDEFANGILDPRDLDKPKTIIITREDRMMNHVSYPELNLVHSSGNHLTFIKEKR